MSGPGEPGLQFTINSRKITEYLLNSGHPAGGSKARFFLAFGFAANEADILARALLDHPRSGRLVLREASEWGTQLNYEGRIRSTDGRDPNIVTARLVPVTQPGTAKLVTAFPA